MLKVALFAMLFALVWGPAAVGESSPRVARSLNCPTPKDDRVEPADFATTQCFPSPDGRKRVVIRSGRISIDDGVKTVSAGVIDYGRLIWNPASTGFVVQDNAGSGQTSYFSYVDLRQSSPRRIKALRWTAARLYARRFKCGGPAVYVHSWFGGWQDAEHVRLLVVQGVHSEGCIDPDAIGVVGNPVTGGIDQVLTEPEARAAWCAPGRRSEDAPCSSDP
jgi:hypothetical protein